jgi:hypothetical protein
VRQDAQIAHAGIVGEHDEERRGGAARALLLVEEIGDGGRADGAAREDLGECWRSPRSAGIST